MTTSNNLPTPSINWTSMGKRMLVGATIGLVLMTIFLMGVQDPKPEWGKYWMIRPLVVISVAGAMGAAFFYFVTAMFPTGSKRVLATILGIVVFIIGLWLGSVAGLDGTLWD
jgi:heme A synthase